MSGQRSLKDILSGLIFVAIGLGFGFAAAGYEIGTALRMGPGYFPIVLAGILVALGLAITVNGFLATEDDSELGAFPVRGIVLLLGAIAFFGATVRGLGLGPSLFLTIFAAALASDRNTPLSAFVLAAGLTAFCILIFVFGLGVPLPLLGPWIT